MRPIEQRLNTERRSRERNVRRKYIIVSEGYVTEPLYFQGLRDNRGIAGISSLVDVVILQRYRSDSGVSDPLRILDLLDEYMESVKTGHYRLESVVHVVSEQLPDDPELHKVMSGRLEKLTDDKGYVINLDEARYTVSDILKPYGYDKRVSIPDLIDYQEEVDSVCVIVDRDRSNRGADKIDEFIRRCRGSGYKPYISNPCFELWFLMHFDSYDSIDPKQLLTNPMVGSKRFTEDQLDMILKEEVGHGYNKTRFDCITFIERTENAIDRSKTACTDPRKLKYELGTNVGVLLENMRGKDDDSDIRFAPCRGGIRYCCQDASFSMISDNTVSSSATDSPLEVSINDALLPHIVILMMPCPSRISSFEFMRSPRATFL